VRNTNPFFRVLIIFFCSVFIFPSCASLSPVDSQREKPVKAQSPEGVIPRWRPFAEDAVRGLAYFSGKISRPGISFWALRIDLNEPETRIVVKGGGGSADNTLSTRVSSFVRDNGLLAGINALPFDPVSGREGEKRSNAGIVVSEGIMVSPPHPSFDALVFYDHGGAAIVSQAEIASAEHIAEAAGGFHRILNGRELAGPAVSGKARHPRSAAGLSDGGGSGGRFLYLLVIDGRRIGSIGATEGETALLLRALGATDGINLDGGGSSALVLRYPDGSVKAVNTPIHSGIPGRERAVAGCIGISGRR
jgi:hypothetical protein